MSVNILVPVNKDLINPVMANKINDVVNEWGECTGAFEWCDLFQGDGGCVLSLEKALAFDEESSPWFMLTLDEGFLKAAQTDSISDLMRYTEFFWCNETAKFDNNQDVVADWKALLRESKCDDVIFIKART